MLLEFTLLLVLDSLTWFRCSCLLSGKLSESLTLLLFKWVDLLTQGTILRTFFVCVGASGVLAFMGLNVDEVVELSEKSWRGQKEFDRGSISKLW